ncbi:hypothetical protein Ct9H90mP12_1490 [bacterium]|nr:MAG: hypothetical protein Ct9H90mP12_1490 [bacterium]
MNYYKHYYLFLGLLFLSCEGPVFDVPADEDSIPPTLTITFFPQISPFYQIRY